MGWLIALGAVLLLAVLPLGISAIYNAHGFVLRVIIGPLHITLLPGKKREKKAKKDVGGKQTKTKQEKPAKKQTKKEHEDKKGGSILDFMPLLRIVLDFLSDFRRKLRVNVLQVKLILAGGDPSDLAINFGRAWTAIGNLMPQLERALHICKRDIQVECDFVSEKTVVYARLDMTITLGRVLFISVRHGCRALIQLSKILKIRKGGAVK